MMLILLVCCSLAANLNCADSLCTSCTSGYLYRNISCVSICPENSFYSGGKCEISDEAPFIKLHFASFLSFESAKIGDFEHPQGLPFQDSGKNSPIPTKYQGFYFTTTSSLVLNNKALAPSFTLEFYIKVNSAGTIFTLSDSNNEYLKVIVQNGLVVISTYLMNINTWVLETLSTTITSNWFDFNFGCSLSLGYSTIMLQNSIYKSLANSEFLTISGLKFTIGDSSSSFKGFMYYFYMANSLDYYLTPAIDPLSCDYLEYYDLTSYSCQSCMNGCSTWPWCVRSNSCNVCYNSYCSSCTGFSLFYCDSCSNSNSPPYCSPGPNCASGSIFNCNSCSSGYTLSSGICIYPPYNYVSGSTAPVMDFKFDYISEFYDIFYSGDISGTYAPFNNMESDDPYPIYNRGLYFDSTVFLKSSSSISLHHDFSIGIWFYKLDYSWRTIFKGSNLIITDHYPMIYILQNYDESIFYVSSTVYINKGYWNYLTLSMKYENSTVTIGVGQNNTFTIDTTYEGYQFYNLPSTYYFGKSFAYISEFFGFIYSFTLWYNYITDFSSVISPCNTAYTCLWVASLYEYHNEYEDKSMTCDSSCQYGCKTWGTCNQCDSVQCSACSNYYSSCSKNLATPCLSGLHLTVNDKCCDLKCTDCYGEGYFRCLSCDSGYMHLGNLCLDKCPSFSQNVGAECDIVQELVVKVSFDCISNDIIDEVNSVKFMAGELSEFWPHTEDFDPIPVYMRGFYFNQKSFVASEPLIMSHNVSLVFFLKIEEDGTVFEKNTISLAVDGSKIIFNYYSNIFEFDMFPLKSWVVLVLQIASDIDGFMTVSLYTQGSVPSPIYSSSELVFIDNDSTLYLGSSSSSFRGFLWEFQIYFSTELQSSFNIIICSDSKETNCVWDCELLELLSGQTCTSCLDTCEMGCRTLINCNICSNPYCTTCSNYKTCGNCPTNSELTQIGCVCLEGYQMKNSICEYCEYYLEDFCVPVCPVGYVNQGRKCVVEYQNGEAVKLLFNELASVFLDSFSEVSVKISNNQVLPVYMRGIYFSGNFSALMVPNEPDGKLLLGIRFFICLWAYISKSGVLMGKFGTDAEIFDVYFDELLINAKIILGSDVIQGGSLETLEADNWNHLIIGLQYTEYSELSIYFNGNLKYSEISADYFADTMNSSLILGSFSNSSFAGFIYSFELWVEFPEFSQLFKKPCNNCDICLLSGNCLSPCNISMHFSNNKCENCLEECTSGCRYNGNCSVCADNYCMSCESYEEKSCIECSIGYILVDKLCVPCEEGFYYNEENKLCEACKGLCETCLNSQVCSSCRNFSNLVNEKCECIQGYYENIQCIRTIFECYLKINEKNEFFIEFSEELQEKLKNSDVLVEIDKTKAQFNLTQIDGFQYKFVLQGEIFDTKKKLTVTFLNQIISNKNSLLGVKSIEGSLFILKQNKSYTSFLEIEKFTRIIFLASIGAVTLFSAISVNPKCLFTFLNSAELFSYSLLYNFDMEEELVEFLKNMQITSNLPSIFDLIPTENYAIPDEKLPFLGFNTLIIYQTSGLFLSCFILILFCNFICKIFNFIQCFSRMQKIFRFKAYLRFWIQTFFELFFGSVLTLKFLNYSSIHLIANLILAFCILV